MTQIEVTFAYNGVPSENAVRAIDRLRDVYGIRRVTFNQSAQNVKVEYDASRLKQPAVATLLRRAGLDILDRDTAEFGGTLA